MDYLDIQIAILFLSLLNFSVLSLSTKQLYHDSLLTKQEKSDHFSYAVVVDCGSSGSRAHIFQWPSNTSINELPSKIRPMKDPETGEVFKRSIRPGLSSLRDQPEAASDYMKPIMDYISTHVPLDSQRETPVYFLGTAGLRLLKKEVQEEILEDIARDLKGEYNFPVLITEVISGVQEGIYQWLSVNSHGERLKSFHDQKRRNFFCQAPKTRRYAMLEMGGASAQVTFEMTPELNHIISYTLRPNSEASRTYSESKVNLDLANGDTLNLFSVTFLGLGTNSAREAAIDLLVRDALRLSGRFNSHNQAFIPIFYSPNTTLVLEDPCLPLGAQDIALKPVELLYNQERTIGFNSRVRDETFTVRLFGKGNYMLCQRLLYRLLWTIKKEHTNCNDNSAICSSAIIGTNFVPFQYFQFIGLGELYYTTKEMVQASGLYNRNLVQSRAADICSTPYELLLIRYPNANRFDKKRVLLECFKAVWIDTWLHVGLKMPIKYSYDYQNVNKINNEELDWTLGALIGYPYLMKTDALIS